MSAAQTRQGAHHQTTTDNEILRFQHRVLQDALSHASALFWARRAQALERALPRPDDFHGGSTPEQLRERHERLQAEIRACRAHANLLASRAITTASDEDLLNVMREVAA